MANDSKHDKNNDKDELTVEKKAGRESDRAVADEHGSE
jgi:hypothetical protein